MRMNILIRNPAEFQRRFNASVSDAKYAASNLAELFSRLEILGDDCVGMKVSLGGASFVVVKEGDTFVLVDSGEL